MLNRFIAESFFLLTQLMRRLKKWKKKQRKNLASNLYWFKEGKSVEADNLKKSILNGYIENTEDLYKAATTTVKTKWRGNSVLISNWIATRFTLNLYVFNLVMDKLEKSRLRCHGVYLERICIVQSKWSSMLENKKR